MSMHFTLHNFVPDIVVVFHTKKDRHETMLSYTTISLKYLQWLRTAVKNICVRIEDTYVQYVYMSNYICSKCIHSVFE